MRWHGFQLTRRRGFSVLCIFAALMLIAPPRWSNSLKGAAQLLVPPQDLFYSGAHRALSPVAASAGRTAASSSETAAQEAELVAQKALIDQLRGEIESLKAVRRSLLPAPLPLLPARVVAWDIAEWRDSVLVARGSSRNVGWKDWVTAPLILDKGGLAGVDRGQPVLSRHCLLGRVEQVSPYMARVRLLTDVDAPRIKVQIGGRTAAGIEWVDFPCSLRGVGRGRMMIENVEYRVIEQPGEDHAAPSPKRIRAGDWVFSAPGQLDLPVPLLIGKVTNVAENPRKRLVFNLTVEPPVGPADLHEVFVIPVVPTANVTVGEGSP